jgi:hypothetical protein
MVIDNERLWELFHRKWSRDVGTEGYNKKEWVELEAEILKAIKKARISEATAPLYEDTHLSEKAMERLEIGMK